MAIALKDYYKVLGLAPEATAEEIRAAFRQLARQYHPDVAPGSEDKFKEIQEAYDVLGHPGRRRRYDYLARFERHSGFEGPRRDDEDYDDDEDEEEWSELTRERFTEYFQQLFGHNRSEDAQEELESEITVTLEEAALGSVRSLSLKRSIHCRHCFGVGRVNQQLCAYCRGHGSVEREEACKVNIPPGVRPGVVLRVPKMARKVGLNGEAEDLLLRVRFAPHRQFERNGDDLRSSLTLAPWEAALGGQISVPTLTGRVNVTVPAGAQHGGKLRLKGRGLPRRDGSAGDLIIDLRIALPTQLTPKERAAWEYLRDVATFRPREAPEASE